MSNNKDGDGKSLAPKVMGTKCPPSDLPIATSVQSTAKEVLTVKRRFSAAAPVFSDDELLIEPPKEETNLYLWSSLIAGFGSGALASIVCAPMDLMRTRMQVMGGLQKAGASNQFGAYSHIASHLRKVIQTEGARGCFRGLGATLATVPTFWGIYFPLYETFKHKIAAYQNNGDVDGRTSPWVHLTSAIAAGAFADVSCNPMFVVRTRMQTEQLHLLEATAKNGAQILQDHVKPMNIRQTMTAVYAEGGIEAFWRGLTASLIGLSHVAIQFPVYEFLKAEARARNPDGRERPIDLLLASGFSKVCGSLVSYPHEVLRSRMMDARGPDAGRSVSNMFRHVVATEGYNGLYKGLNISLIRVIPNCCVTFLTYELFMRWSKQNLSKFYED